MARTLACFAAVVTAFGVGAPAYAQIIDVRVASGREASGVEVAFRAPATAAEARLDQDRVIVTIAGVTAPQATWSLRRAGPLSAMRVEPAEGGVRLVFPTSAASSVRAQTWEGRVRVSVAHAPGASGAAQAAPTPEVSSPKSAPSRPVATAPIDAPLDPAVAPPSSPELGDLTSLDSLYAAEVIAGESDADEPAAAAEAPPALDPEDAAAAARAAEVLTAGLVKERCPAAAAALEADPWDLEHLDTHGLCLAEAGDAAGAAQVFERLASFDPSSVDALLGIALAAQAKGDTVKAAETLAEALIQAKTDGEAAKARAFGAALGVL